MIYLQNVSKTYKSKEKINFLRSKKISVEAVKNLSMTIHKGKITGLLGINGAGKTTTVKMLSTLLEPTYGTIYMDDLSYKQNIKEMKKRVNMIAGGERMIYWRLTARENLTYFGYMYGLHGKTLSQRIDELIHLVGLEDKGDVPVEKYSKGMKQRLQIARGLINNPDYIFLDEPTLGLDVQIAKDMRLFFRDLATRQNKGILLTSHYMQEVEELCDYIYILHEGKLIKEGTPEDITKSHGDSDNLEEAILSLSESLKEAI